MSNHIYLYGAIGVPEEVNTRDILNSINNSDDDLVLHISSPGGDVYDGLTIMNCLRSCVNYVTVIIEGIAASAASFIAVGGADKVVMRPNSELMIHEAGQGLFGNASDLEKSAQSLRRVTNTIASIYAEKTGVEADKWLDAMSVETWFTAEEAVEAGLADVIEDGKENKEKFNGEKALALMNSYQGRKNAPDPSLLVNNNYDLGDNDMSFINNVAYKLGLNGEDFKEDQVLNALTEVLNEAGEVEVEKTVVISIDYKDSEVEQESEITITPVISEELPEGTTFSVDGESFINCDENTGVLTISPEDANPETFDYTVKIDIPGSDSFEVNGKVTVIEKTVEENDNTDNSSDDNTVNNSILDTITLDKESYDELKRLADLGFELQNKRKTDDLENEVDNWISTGRLSASRKADILNAMKKDEEGIRNIISNIPENTIPRVTLGSSKTGSIDNNIVDSEKAAARERLKAAGLLKD